GDRCPECRTLHASSLSRLRILFAGRGRLLAAWHSGLDGHAGSEGALRDRRSLSVPRSIDAAKAPDECVRRSVLPAGFLPVLLRPVTWIAISPLRSQHRPLAEEQRCRRDTRILASRDAESNPLARGQLATRA